MPDAGRCVAAACRCWRRALAVSPEWGGWCLAARVDPLPPIPPTPTGATTPAHRVPDVAVDFGAAAMMVALLGRGAPHTLTLSPPLFLPTRLSKSPAHCTFHLSLVFVTAYRSYSSFRSSASRCAHKPSTERRLPVTSFSPISRVARLKAATYWSRMLMLCCSTITKSS